MTRTPPRHVRAVHAGAASRHPRRLVVSGLLGVGVLLGGAVLLGSGVPASSDGSGRASCPPTGPRLRVVVTPELARVVDEVARSVAVPGESVGGGSCVAADVVASAPDEVLAGLTGTSPRPDVWLPDSSSWLGRPEAAAAALPAQGSSVARSPLVLALATGTARGLSPDGQPLTLDGLLPALPPDGPLRLGLPAARSVTTAGGVLAVQSAVADRPDARVRLTAALRSSPDGLPALPDELLERIGQDLNLVVPVSEQSFDEYARAPGAAATTSVPVPGVELDYPYVVLTGDGGRAEQAGRLLAALRSPAGQELLLRQGFRNEAGRTGSEAGTAPEAGPARVPEAGAVQAALRTLEAVRLPARILAVLDVSGSMRQRVPEAGGLTRLELTKRAAAEGLSLYPDDTDIGLWAFSTGLSPGADHAELVPVQPLGPDATGTTGRERLAVALSTITPIPSGGTGLYDTALAAVRAMTASWARGRANGVVLLSDGRDEGSDGVTLEQLLATLAAEQDPQRPVPVVTIAFGPDGDTEALAAISRATSGASYVAKDPGQIRDVFLDAVGQRSCRPRC